MRDWKWFQNSIEEIVCNTCSERNVNCKSCEEHGDIASVRMLVEDMKNEKILIENNQGNNEDSFVNIRMSGKISR